MPMTLYRYLRIRGLKTDNPDDMRLLKLITITQEAHIETDRELVYKVKLSQKQLENLQSEHPELKFKRPGYARKGV